MKRITITFLIGIFFLTACAGTTPLPLTATISVSKSFTSTPFPTFTPTFDARTIITVTPAPKAECPKENPSLTPDLNTLFSVNPIRLVDRPALDFLNNGGAPQKIIGAFRQHYHWLRSNIATQQDITGDGVPELVVTDGYIVYVFGCKDNQYKTLLSDTDDLDWMQEIQLNTIEDMNLDGIPELLTVEYGGHTYTSIRGSIWEWNGQEFIQLLDASSQVPAHVTVRDTDGNQTLDLVMDTDVPLPISSLYSYLIPWRNETDIYAWSGTHFTLNRVKYSSPEFRFQALQDADRETSYGNFDKALVFTKMSSLTTS